MASQIPGSTGPTTPGQNQVANGVKWRFPPVHPEGNTFTASAAAIPFVAFIWIHWLTWPLIIVTVWVATFFRDPVRSVPQGNNLIVAPADGLITLIETVPVPRELSGEAGLGDAPVTRVSIFMSVFDVHINRTPISGTVT